MTGAGRKATNRAAPADCPFCQREAVEAQLVAESDHFVVVADLQPLVEGHLLLIPKQHLSCYGELPEMRWAELTQLKDRARDFLKRAYAAPTFFEHGVAGQTVPHAHLHAVPGLPTLLPIIRAGRECVPATAPGAVRSWFHERGPYLYYEERGYGLLLAPGEVPPGYLQWIASQMLPGDRPPLDGREAAERVRARWRNSAAGSVMP